MMAFLGKLGEYARPLWRSRAGKVALGVIGVAIVAVSFVAVRRAGGAPSIPTAEVKLGEFVDYVQLRGEVKALRSVVLTAPFGAGDIQIIKLVPNGSLARKGDVVAQFDTITLQRTLEQRQTELKQAEAEIERVRAQARLQEEQDLTELMKARYDVERARLEASKQEILSEIEGAKTKLSLADAEQKLREVEQKLASNRTAAAADIESRKQRRDKALYEVRRTQRNLASMTLTAPSDGMVFLLPNLRSGSPFGGAPEYREGDRAWPGAAIAELPDLASIQISARVDEADRGRLKPGQPASVRVDAVPDKEFSGRVADISALAKPDFSAWPPTRNFDVVVQLDPEALRAETAPGGTPGAAKEERSAPQQVMRFEGMPGKTVSEGTGAMVVRRASGEEAVQVMRGGAAPEGMAGAPSGVRIVRGSGPGGPEPQGSFPGRRTDRRLRPGMSASARVAVERMADSILIPAEAVFQKGGRTVAYVMSSRGPAIPGLRTLLRSLSTTFEERPIEVARRTTVQVLVARGLKPGEQVALKDPTLAAGTEEGRQEEK